MCITRSIIFDSIVYSISLSRCNSKKPIRNVAFSRLNDDSVKSVLLLLLLLLLNNIEEQEEERMELIVLVNAGVWLLHDHSIEGTLQSRLDASILVSHVRYWSTSSNLDR